MFVKENARISSHHHKRPQGLRQLVLLEFLKNNNKRNKYITKVDDEDDELIQPKALELAYVLVFEMLPPPPSSPSSLVAIWLLLKNINCLPITACLSFPYFIISPWCSSFCLILPFALMLIMTIVIIITFFKIKLFGRENTNTSSMLSENRIFPCVLIELFSKGTVLIIEQDAVEHFDIACCLFIVIIIIVIYTQSYSIKLCIICLFFILISFGKK